MSIIHPSNCSNFSLIGTFILEQTLSGFGILLCGTSIALTIYLELYKQLVYRLALYLVTDAFVYGIVCLLYTVNEINEIRDDHKEVHEPLCYMFSFLATYLVLAKLLFTIIMTIHLFVLSVCYKNLKRFEVPCLVATLILPTIPASVPLITGTAGEPDDNSPFCWIRQKDYSSCPPRSVQIGVIEAFVLWFAPGFISLLTMTGLIVVMVCVMLCRMWRASRGKVQNMKAIKQILPLVAYPIITCVLLLVGTFHYMYDATTSPVPQYENVLAHIEIVCFTGYVWTAGLALLVHIVIMLVSRKKRRTPRSNKVPVENNTEAATLNVTSTPAARSSTYYTIPDDTITLLNPTQNSNST